MVRIEAQYTLECKGRLLQPKFHGKCKKLLLLFKCAAPGSAKLATYFPRQETPRAACIYRQAISNLGSLQLQIVGGLVPLGAKGQLQCPRAIVAGRAFVARLQPVRDLRPQALPFKLVTLGAGTAVLNVPFGMWREHTRKFSPEWFLAVHATIPFVAMTRQGIGMPKTVIFLTIASAILGQAFGARLERQRLLLMDRPKFEIPVVADPTRSSVRWSSSNAAKSRGPAFSLDCGFAQESHDGLYSRSSNHAMSLAHNLFPNHIAAVGA